MNHLPLCVVIAKHALGAKIMIAVVSDAHKLEQGKVGIDAHHVEAIVGARAGHADTVAPARPVGGAGHGGI